MKKTTLLTLAVISTALISCASNQGDSFGYVAPPPTEQDLESNEPGPMQQPGGVSAGIIAEQGHPSHDAFITIKE
ncbi:hypothetical protein [Francisella hispaniensis]|uniref:Lipoprotein n=1 Tax=Francisella hispaniensis FSC454 TaxID=1088883 RepID=A0AAC9J6Y3_9GAMM|nr:hypothetical protein [Francisella hispaniensis]APD49935.1 hypothetical protein FSC454_01630 [Francisella hispaniensis FSC454]KYW86274.1 hypothetical protein AUF42_03600 [Francisella hispaniensis FSC454]MBK2356112.1 hypothetical protein [Francisella hispaniensis]